MGRTANHTHLSQRRGTRAPERMVSPTRSTPPSDKRKDGKRTDPGRPNERETHPRKPSGDSGRGNRIGKAPREDPSRTNQMTGRPRRTEERSPPEVERPLWPHNLIPTAEEIRQNRGLPWQITRGRRRSRHSNNTLRRPVNKQRKQETVPPRKLTEATTVESSHIVGTRRTVTPIGKEGNVKNNACKPRR